LGCGDVAIRSVKATKSNGIVKMGDAGLRNTNAWWYGMIRVVGIGPKIYGDGMAV